jgi:signal transduction histidine kinase
LLAFVAHELRSPLAPIRTAAALITIGGPEDLRRAQAIIERQVAHMSRTIDDLLDLSRARTGKLRLEPGMLDISEVVDRAVSACQPAMVRRGQRLEIRGPDGRCALHADVVRLTQILSNLLDNASKYSPDGQAISLTVRRVGRDVELIVADNGIGIDPASMERVFHPFAQDPHAIGFNASGLGLGLAVVHELVTAHGGHVVASSDGIGLGSRFVVTLPCAPMPAARTESSQ